MKTLKNKFRNLDLQVKAMLIAAVVLATLFTTMIAQNGFTQF